MVKGKGTAKPYVSFIGGSASDVTGSMHLVRFKKYVLLLDCGLIQTNNIVADYKANREQLKKIKANEIDYLILSHCHIDHSGLCPALFAKGAQCHIYVPSGSIPFLNILWHDSMKIMEQDCLKIQRKHGIKASPLYTEADIQRTLDRCIEVDNHDMFNINPDISFEYLSAGHIIHAKQIYMNLRDGNIIKRIGYTGDIGGLTPRPFVEQRENIPRVNLLIGENTYNSPSRPNKANDRANDIAKIRTIVEESNKILIPTFSLNRTNELIMILNDMNLDIPIYLDSPLATKFCSIWPDENHEWSKAYSNIKVIKDWDESVRLQESNEHCIIISASGFLSGGRIMAHLKTALKDSNNHLIFIGYAGENNLASQIKSGQRKVVINGVEVKNNANITELRSFSSHASYEELIQYYLFGCGGFDKLALIHGQFSNKVEFANTLNNNMGELGISGKVVCISQDQKLYL